MEKIECSICHQISEAAFCPYCGMKLQPTEEEQKRLEKQRKREEKEEKKKQQENAKLKKASDDAVESVKRIREVELAIQQSNAANAPLPRQHSYRECRTRKQKRANMQKRANINIGITIVVAIGIAIWGYFTNWTFFFVAPPMPVENPNNLSFDVLFSEDLYTLLVVVIIFTILIVAFYIWMGLNDPSSDWRRR
jgi:uncharacterized Zn finger protein (UPF0148 family)